MTRMTFFQWPDVTIFSILDSDQHHPTWLSTATIESAIVVESFLNFCYFKHFFYYKQIAKIWRSLLHCRYKCTLWSINCYIDLQFYIFKILFATSNLNLNSLILMIIFVVFQFNLVCLNWICKDRYQKFYWENSPITSLFTTEFGPMNRFYY